MSIKIFKSIKLSRVLTAILTFSVLYSCQNDDDNFHSSRSQPVHFSSEIAKNGIQTRASNASWDSGDKIGVFMKTANAVLSDQSIVDNRSNVIYNTTTGSGWFTPETTDQTIYYPQNNSAVDFIAYYPYQSTISNYIYKVNIQDQTNPEYIDLLYSNNIVGVSFNSPGNAFKFSHQLSKIKLNIQAGTNISSLNNLQVSLDGVKTLADFDLTNGNFTVDESSVVNLDFNTSINGTTALAEAILIPDNGGTGRVIKIKLSGGVTFDWEIPTTTNLEKGYQYTFNITLNSNGAVVTPLIGWQETPMMSSTLPANQMYIKHMMPNDNKIRNYAMLYDTQYKLAYWVAYPLHSYYIGSSGRGNAWQYDPSILKDFQSNLSSSYTPSDLDRGHQLPSSDRTRDKASNATTFYYTNMTPQYSNLNQKTWAKLEDKVRSWVDKCDTLYVVTGAMVTTPTDKTVKYTTDQFGGQAAMPKYYYKALAQRKGDTYITVAFKLDNHNSYTAGDNINNYRMSVTELEELTGFTFFPSVSSSVKNNIDASQWN